MTTNPPKPRQAEMTDKAPAATSAPQDKATQTAVQAHVSNAAPSKNSPVLALAHQLQFHDAASFAATLKATIMPGNSSDAQVAMLCSVALAHKLNPLKREIYAFPDKGGIRPIIGIDGWYTIANSDPAFSGISFEFGGATHDKTLWCECTIHRKDREHPVVVREFLEECFRATEPWKASPRRMLRHRAAIQAIRIAFGLAGIMDEEEYRRMVELDERAARTAPAGSHGTPRTAADAAGQLAARAEARRTGATGNAQGSPAQAATEPEDVEFVAHDDPAEELAPSEPLAPDPAGDFPPYPSDAIDTTTRD